MVSPLPPVSTTFFLTGSSAAIPQPRPKGDVAGCSFCQAVPVQSQVPWRFGILWVALKPPNITSAPVIGSLNITGPVARGGDDVILAWVQVEVAPSHSHVSCKNAELLCPPLNPPNITNF